MAKKSFLEDLPDICLSDCDLDQIFGLEEDEPGIFYCPTSDSRRKKLGNLLKVGLIDEIGNPGNPSTAAIREAVIYLYLGEYISADCYNILKKFWTRGMTDFMRPALDVFNEFSSVLLGELLGKIEVESFEELVEKLNVIKIPEWISISLQWLEDILPKARLIGDTLYFLDDSKDSRTMDLFSISVKNIKSNYDIQDLVNFIGSDFTEILGVSKPDLMYLRSSKVGRFYIYNTKSDNFEIIRGDFHFALGSSSVITTEGGNLMVRSIHGISLICKAGNYERYEKSGSFIKVLPDFNAPGFFQPYYLDIYGCRNEVSDEEKRKFLWDFLIFSPWVMDQIKGGDILPEKMNAEGIMESLNETFAPADRCSSEHLINLESLLMFMESLLGEDHDLMDILYTLADIDKKMNDFKNIFPSDDLLTNLGALHRIEKKELTKSLLNIDRKESVEYLRKALLQDRYDKFYGDVKEKTVGLIGAFTCQGDALKVITKQVDEV